MEMAPGLVGGICDPLLPLLVREECFAVGMSGTIGSCAAVSLGREAWKSAGIAGSEVVGSATCRETIREIVTKGTSLLV